METKFQTSFIPKKPLISDPKTAVVKHGGTSVLMILGSLLFIVSLGSAVACVVWKNMLMKSQETYKAQLIDSEKRFDIASIENLKKVNTKIDTGKMLLKNHLSVSAIFPIINQLIIESVRINSFEFLAPEKGLDGVKITMRGIAKDYNSIAFQSDVFGSSEKYGTNKIIKNPIVADMSEDSSGGISFSFSGTLNSGELSYEKVLDATLKQEQ